MIPDTHHEHQRGVYAERPLLRETDPHRHQHNVGRLYM